MRDQPLHILLVEDDPGYAGLLTRFLQSEHPLGSQFIWAETLEDALAHLQSIRFDVILLDLSLPDSIGLSTFLDVEKRAPDTAVIVLTGLDDEEMAMRTVQAGAQDYLAKGDVNARGLARAIRYAMERQATQQELREVSALQSAILDSANYSIISTDPDGLIRTFNRSAARWLGYRPAEVVGARTPLLFHDEDEVARRAREIFEATGEVLEPSEVFTRTPQQGAVEEREWTYIRKDGSRFPVHVSVSALRDAAGSLTGFLEIASDITERKRAEEERDRLLASEREKSEQLKLSVREAHHRIKNNLQAICDLLYLEIGSAGGHTPEEAMRESMERVQAIALVHDLLSQHEDVQTVDTRAVLERLVPMVLRSSGLSLSDVEVSLDVPSLRLSSKKATTLALIVNELVSNAAKHAYRATRSGQLQVTLRQDAEDLVLDVRDSGPGLPDGFDIRQNANVGLEVARIMAERDLGGSLTLTNSNGVQAQVRFRW
jgi:PAS domain S-box-containing protein